jgi:putative hydrolase of the HAD superfamily
MLAVENHTTPTELISFDVWLTLIKSNSGYKQAQADLISRRFGIAPEGFTELMKEEDRATDKETDQNGIQYGPVDRLNRIAKRVGVHASSAMIEDLSDEIQDLFVDYPIRIMEPYLLESIDGIRDKGYQTALVSNTGFINGSHMRLALAEAGIIGRMDYAVFSNEVGVAKPNPKIYEALSIESSIELPNILHVGDNYKTDYIGPQEIGMQSVHLSGSSPAAYHVSSIAVLGACLPNRELAYDGS